MTVLDIIFNPSDSGRNVAIIDVPAPCILKNWFIQGNQINEDSVLILSKEYVNPNQIGTSGTGQQLPKGSMLMTFADEAHGDGTDNRSFYAITPHKMGFDEDDKLLIQYYQAGAYNHFILLQAEIDFIPKWIYEINYTEYSVTEHDVDTIYNAVVAPFNGKLRGIKGTLILDVAETTGDGTSKLEIIHIPREVYNAWKNHQNFANEDGDVMTAQEDTTEQLMYGNSRIVKHIFTYDDTDDNITRFSTKESIDIAKGDVFVYRVFNIHEADLANYGVDFTFLMQYYGDEDEEQLGLELAFIDDTGIETLYDKSPEIIYG